MDAAIVPHRGGETELFREARTDSERKPQIPRLRFAALDLITTLAPGGSGLLFLCEENRRLRQEPTMLIIGCDFHAGFQVLAIFASQNASQEVPLSGSIFNIFIA